MPPLALLLPLSVSLLAAAAAAEPVAEGRAVAERWCAGCHAVPGGAATDTAPSMAAMARDGALSASVLAVRLTAPHPPMPDPGLSREQIEAVVAYLASLRP